jgi:two-component system, sensor histidine kinase and response regulator
MPDDELHDVNILVVDDNVSARRLIVEYLKPTRATIYNAAGGLEALEILQSQSIDLVILDILMPVMDGYEVLEHMRAAGDLREIPVVVVSALGEVQSVVQCLRLGAEDYLYKPINRTLLLARVRNSLEKRHLRLEELRHLENMNQLKDQFVRTITHEMKNPLALISGYVELLIEDDVVPEGQPTEFLLSIQRYTTQMNTLVQDLLDLSKINMTLSLEPVDIAMLIENCIADMNVLAQKKAIHITFDRPAEALISRVDTLRMQRVFNNLISNAIKYTINNGQIMIRAYVDADSQDIVISVADNGIGIPLEDQDRIFESFYRVRNDSHQEIEGTGLGLAIAQTIVEQHSGQITVQSTPGEGSVFTVHLPQ